MSEPIIAAVRRYMHVIHVYSYMSVRCCPTERSESIRALNGVCDAKYWPLLRGR